MRFLYATTGIQSIYHSYVHVVLTTMNYHLGGYIIVRRDHLCNTLSLVMKQAF